MQLLEWLNYENKIDDKKVVVMMNEIRKRTSKSNPIEIEATRNSGRYDK